MRQDQEQDSGFGIQGGRSLNAPRRDFGYNVSECGGEVYTLGYGVIPDLKPRRNELNQDGIP